MLDFLETVKSLRLINYSSQKNICSDHILYHFLLNMPFILTSSVDVKSLKHRLFWLIRQSGRMKQLFLSCLDLKQNGLVTSFASDTAYYVMVDHFSVTFLTFFLSCNYFPSLSSEVRTWLYSFTALYQKITLQWKHEILSFSTFT